MQNKETFNNQLTNKQMNNASDVAKQLPYQSIVTNEGMMLQLADGTIVACNLEAQNILGLTVEQMQGWTSIEPRWQAIHEDGSPFVGEDHASMVALRTGKPCLNVVMGLYKPSGDLIWILINAQPLFQVSEAAPYGVVTTFSDITEQKELESERNLSTESLPVPEQGKPQQRTILIVDDSPEDHEMYRRYLLQDSDYNYKILVAESGAAALRLCQRHHLDGILLDFLLPDMDGLEFLELFVNKRNPNNPPVIMLTGQGNEAVAVQAMKAGAFDYLVKGRLNSVDLRAVVNSVIEKAQLQAQLQHSEERLKLAVDAANIGIWEWNIPNNKLIWSELVSPIFGLPPGTCLPNYEAFLDAVYPEDRQNVAQAMTRSLEEGTKYNIEFRIVWHDNTVHWLHGKGEVYRDQRGQPQRMVGTVIDITQAKQAEEERQQQFLKERLVAQIAQQIRCSLALDQILNTTVTKVRQFLQADRVIIFRLQPDGSGTVITESVSSEWTAILSTNIYDPCFVKSYVEPYQQGLVTAKADICNSNIEPCHVELLTQFQVKANLVVPILQGEQLWGLLIVHQCSAPRQWQPEEIDLLSSLATQVGIAIQQSSLVEELQNELAERQQVVEQLRQSQQFIQQIANTVPGLLYVYDVREQQNVYLNAQAFELLEYTSEQIQDMGKDFIPQVMHPDDLARMPLHFEQLQSTPHHLTVGFEYRMQHLNGEWRWFYSRDKVFSYNFDGTIRQILGIAQDITERKQWENERESLLAREQASRNEAETANRIKDEFLAVLSHELRSPLNPILGWSRLLQTRQLGAAKTAEALLTIERNAKLQAELIEDLLDVSRILRGKISLNIAAVNLKSTVLSALDTVRLMVEAKSIQLQTVLQPNMGQVIGDQARLQQVVWNLVSNAVKFTPAGGRVDVRVEQVDTYAQIQVIDTGKGISPDFLPYVFDYFRQADSATTRKFGGLGLGLAIVRHLVELHGGTIFAESRGEGQGATFTVRLPLLKAGEVGEYEEMQDAASSVTSEFSLSGVRILVVDDEVDSREFVAFTLEQYGAEVMAVPSAFDALQALAQVKPDVLVSDIGMPEMDGYMLMRQIRAELPQESREIPAIALTAYAGEFDQQQAASAGFQMHLSKPVMPVRLVDAVAKLIKRD